MLPKHALPKEVIVKFKRLYKQIMPAGAERQRDLKRRQDKFPLRSARRAGPPGGETGAGIKFL